MKLSIRKYISLDKAFFAAILLLASCDNKEIGPELPDAATYVAPSWVSPATAGTTTFTPETVSDLYEQFIWKNADYGIRTSVRYDIEVATDEAMTDPKTLKVTNGQGVNTLRWDNVTIKEANDALLSLGLPADQEATVYLRIKSAMVGITNDPLYSDVISRKATPFRTSDCGNFCSIGLIGAFTGWGEDVDMHLADVTGADKFTWTVTTYITAGGAKFRANDSWDDNWGSAAFPTGTGTPGGSDIVVSGDGYYKVTFNDATGEYSFVAAGAKTFASIGVIGEQSGWGNDIADLVQDAGDPHVWTGTIALTAGKVKFRAEDAWDDNWGGAGFPSDYGVGGGSDIVVPVDATYFIYFNDASGLYMFGPTANGAPYTTIGIIGTATPGGWDTDTDFIKNPAVPYQWSKRMLIEDGVAKFRAENAWDVNWGAGTFPKGTGVQNGSDIPVQGGTYFISFNSLTGEYYFLK